MVPCEPGGVYGGPAAACARRECESVLVCSAALSMSYLRSDWPKGSPNITTAWISPLCPAKVCNLTGTVLQDEDFQNFCRSLLTDG